MTPSTTSTLAPQDPVLARATDLNAQIMHLTRTMQVLKNNVGVTGSEGVPWSTYLLLFHLIGGGPRRAGALAEVACTDPSTVSRQVDTLVRLGLVERQADPVDGRATLLVATAAGIAKQEQMRAGRDQMTAGVLRSWSDDDVHRLTDLLGRFNADLTEQLPDILAAMHRRSAQADDFPKDPT